MPVRVRVGFMAEATHVHVRERRQRQKHPQTDRNIRALTSNERKTRKGFSLGCRVYV
jgi:hypothetical protein